MRSRVIRAGAALFMATAAFVPVHMASASTDNGNQDVPGFQCPADQALFDQIKAWIVEFGPQLADPSQADPDLQPQLELLAGLALLSDDDLCLTLSGGDGGGSTSTSEPESTSTSEPESSTSTSEPETTSTTSENSTTSTTSEETTTTVPEETTTTTARETTTTTRPATTSTTAATTSTTAAITSTTAATTSTTAATATTEAHTTTDPTVGGIVVTGAGTLPVTGNDPAPLVALGFLMAGLGLSLLVMRRRFTV